MTSADYDSLIWDQFLARNGLLHMYLKNAADWYSNLVDCLLERVKHTETPILLALNGCQGSGKTTLADYLATYIPSCSEISVSVLALDDFYLDHAARQRLAREVHPLLATRGVPGTHETSLLKETLDRLMGDDAIGTKIPQFDKSMDDRRPISEWLITKKKPKIIILEGWCLGAQPSDETDLVDPVNNLERLEDLDGSWRRYVNEQLKQDYLPIFSRFDLWAMLKAPSYDSVYAWRLEQEQKLVSTKSIGSSALMNSEEILRFIQHYERLTLNCLKHLPAKVNYLYELNKDRVVTRITTRN